MLTIGIDLGTSGIKAVLFEDTERAVATAAQPIAVSIPHVGWSEQDPDAWVAAVWTCLDSLSAQAPREMAAVEGIGLSGQMLAALLLGSDLRPLRPAILWNDQRSITECAELLALCPDIGLRTNGRPDPGIAAPKLLWLQKHEPEVMARARMLMLTKDYVRLALTGEVASDPTDAGGTQLLDCRTGAWDPALSALVGWDPANLPPLVDAWHAAGGLRPELATRWGMRAGLPVACGSGDNMGSTLGAGAATSGDAVLTIGTSGVSCIVDHMFHPGPSRAILTSAHAAPDTFLSMGVVMSATAALDWTAKMGRTTAADLAGEAEVFAAEGRISAAPVFLPCLNGIRTPLNRPDMTGRMEGLHPGVTHPMLGYAVMEGVAFQFADCVAAQRDVGVRASRFLVVGGGSRSPLWLRLLATALGQPLEVPSGAEIAGPAGAARMAAVAAGAPLSVLSRRLPMLRTIEPDGTLDALLAARKARFDALSRDDGVTRPA
jgi:xylulokinase